MSQITPEMQQLAREVLKEGADLTSVMALVDCAREQLDRPDFRFDPEWVEKLELTLRVWWVRLMRAKWSYQVNGHKLSDSDYMACLHEYRDLRTECAKVFDRPILQGEVDE